MNTATQTITLTDKLVKAKIPKATVTELLDYVDNKQGELAAKQDITIVWSAIAILAAIMVGGFFWLASEITSARQELKTGMRELKTDMRELKTDMRELKTDMNKRMDRIEILIQKKR